MKRRVESEEYKGEKERMGTAIIYGSRYGSAKKYAEALAERMNLKAERYSSVKDPGQYDTVIYVGALYSERALGLEETAQKLDADRCRKLIIVTVGMFNPEGEGKAEKIRESVEGQLPEALRGRAEYIHLRGNFDYKKLSLKHKLMMRFLGMQLSRIPKELRGDDVSLILAARWFDMNFMDMDRLDEVVKAAGREI
ncbi:flavodoxin domain-containing protein [Ruminococcus sp. CLA-AA-H200]|uniref:Flavodoxin domain-containing protein n=1 Tax=Ruminococcus turbiniformis TaxID=2881258 RepID=A0ABS8FY31_9FIRM|nr:flavodoxin domain-containing protein [Ruminococcus turbiniformis]MCC2254931.1 flavodoxin domain-containing protein [Ruminococcus turbiniformis]